MNKIITCLTILLSLLFVVCSGAEDKKLSKTIEPEALEISGDAAYYKMQYALFLKEDLIKEIKTRWEFIALTTDTYQYELAQLAAKMRSSSASGKNDRNTALLKKIQFLSVLLNDIGKEVEDSLNNLTLDEALLLFGKTSALLKGVDEVRYSVMLDDLFGGNK